jgi:glycosyltransferase involved in cell wall biosynthesis
LDEIIAVVPAYRVEAHIEKTLYKIPSFVQHIIVVDDASPDNTAHIVTSLQKKDSRLLLVRHKENQGVGGAMLTGFRKALELGAQIVIKIDGDGQMSEYDLRPLLTPLLRGQADYAKGNRFRDFNALKSMPLTRRFGNMALSFLVKAATGYWDCFDPTNGFLAIRYETLQLLPFEQIDKSYFFETSMLGELYLLGAVIRDVPYPAVYGDEISNLSIRRTLKEFPQKLFRMFFRRIWIRHFLYDFSMESIYLLVGIPSFLFGLVFGIVKWIKYSRLGIPAPTGTIMIAVLSVMLGVQILLSAIGIDLQSVPKEPICQGNPICISPEEKP